jgi:predicted ABC-type ATPase
VYASEATIFARVRERKEKTGRDVPEELVRQSLAAMDHSLNKLTPLCDFVV